jgi:hypothetical protein
LVNYTEVKQQIVFQNWHSLGLNSTPKGLPMRVTAGNSVPDGGSKTPRLNTVWYSNFSVGTGALQGVDFEKPSKFCIPVGMDALKEALGFPFTPTHMHDSRIHDWLHDLAHAEPAQADLTRAQQKRPGDEASGPSFGEAMAKLNKLLRKETGLVTEPCSNFSLEELHEVQRELFAARSPTLQALYEGDRRSLRYANHSEMSESHAAARSWVREQPGLLNKLRDGLCHELVMMYVHHLSASARSLLKKAGNFVLPLLPEDGLHSAPPAGVVGEKGMSGAVEAAAHKDYTAKTSCAICHVGGRVASSTRSEYVTV